LTTKRPVMALTFDACGGRPGSGGGYDAGLIRYLRQEGIPAALFLSGRWIDANKIAVRKLAENPLFRIENHGLDHKPCSASGRPAYGIQGTKNAIEIIDEIAENALKIEELTGRKPEFYRPGTGYLDEVCVEIANILGHEVVNFNVVGDGGATYSRGQVKEALLKSPASSIVIMHMNRPGSETAEGLRESVPELRRRGIQFVELSSQGLR
jgi:peptidoglycan/xylan/chitin deacetylase (PgdA/CDA1 family)